MKTVHGSDPLCNDLSKPWIVQKFGEAYGKTINDIRKDHIALSNTYISSPHIHDAVQAQIDEKCLKLTQLLSTIEETGVDAQSWDVTLCKGVVLACHLMSGILEDQNVLVCCVGLSDLIKGMETDKVMEDTLFYRRVSDALTKKIHACGDRVPVVTGYFGQIEGGILNRVGRGYTDPCAALVAVGIHVQELQIWKEVDVSVALLSATALLGVGGEKETLNTSLIRAIDELSKHGKVHMTRGLAMISLISKGMIQMKGMAGDMFSVLGKNGINIEMISQGAMQADSNLSEPLSSQQILPNTFKPPQVFQNVNLLRSTNLEKGYIRETVNVVIENIDSKPQDQYYIPFSADIIDKVGGLEIRDKKNPGPAFQNEVIAYDPDRSVQSFQNPHDTAY
ncbi:MAG: hypothetical protein Q9218_007302 [Villophora microphyllina]